MAARLDRDIYDWLRKCGEGYSTRINHILRAVMSRVQSATLRLRRTCY